MIHPALSGADHYITTTYCVLLHAAPSIDRKWGPYIVMYYYYEYAVLLIPPFPRSSPPPLIALCVPCTCDLFDSPFCLLRFPYSRGWDLRTVLLAIPRAATYLTQPRQSYLTRLQAIPPIHFFGHPSLQCSLASCLTCCCWGKYGYYGIIGFS